MIRLVCLAVVKDNLLRPQLYPPFMFLTSCMCTDLTNRFTIIYIVTDM